MGLYITSVSFTIYCCMIITNPFHFLNFAFLCEKSQLGSNLHCRTEKKSNNKFEIPSTITMGRCGGLMVSVLEFGLNRLGSNPGQGTMLCSCSRHFTLTVPLFTQVYK